MGLLFLNTHVAWLDDVYMLTVEGEDLSSLHADETPTIHWGAIDRYFPVIVEETIDHTAWRMIFFEELP